MRLESETKRSGELQTEIEQMKFQLQASSECSNTVWKQILDLNKELFNVKEENEKLKLELNAQGQRVLLPVEKQDCGV